MTSSEYLVEMTFTPYASLLSPQEIVTFIERMALPTMEMLEKLVASGRIRAGGAALASGNVSFIAGAASPQELEEMVFSLPLTPRSEVRILPLSTFGTRAEMIRGRLARAKALVAASDAEPSKT